MVGSKQTIEEQVYEQLKNVILSGAFKSGQRLTERELCTQLQVSRTPIRDAIKRLVTEGLLDNEAYKGIIIPRLTVEEVADLIEVRESLEGLAAKKAAVFVTTNQLQLLKENLEQSFNILDKQDIDKLVQMNDQFHQLIISTSKNIIINDILKRLKCRIMLARSTSLYTPLRPTDTLQEHLNIYNALKDKNPDLAEQAMKLHIRNAGSVAIEAIKQASLTTPFKPIK